jgi:hypothetical protein
MDVMKLRATPKAGPYYAQGAPMEIHIDQDKHIAVDGADREAVQWMNYLLSSRLYVAGRGYAQLSRSPGGELERDAATGRCKIQGYVDLHMPEEHVLQAIRDNLEATKQFELQIVAD